MKKTNAQRVLEAQKVPYEAKVYDESGEFHPADEVAERLGVAVEALYKTLVVLRETPHSKPMLVMVAADREIDLRTLARSVGEKKLRMATQREAEQLTGLQVGGISAMALLNRGFDIYIDQPALRLEDIHVSGGARGLDVKLKREDLVRVTRARPVEATEAG